MRVVAWLVVLAVAAGCRPRLEPSLASPDPSAKIPAIKAAAEPDGERQELHDLVDALEDGDVAIRLFAASALKRRTGLELGYRAWDEPAARAEAVGRWREFLGERGVAR